MKIGFIGAGKVGCSFGKYLKENGLDICGYFSKSIESSRFAADFTQSLCFGDFCSVAKASDIIFITVNDSSISDVWENLSSENLEGKIICHCSGALSSDVFSGASEKGAYPCSVHPIAAIDSKDKAFENFAKAFFTVEGNLFACNEIKKILNNIGNKVKIIENSEKKTLYHTACVFQSNFINALVWQGIEFLKRCGFDEDEAFSVSVPLFFGNVENICKKGVLNSLTGPVERCDLQTVIKHMRGLEGDELELYRLLSLKLTEIAMMKNNNKDYDDLKKILEVSK